MVLTDSRIDEDRMVQASSNDYGQPGEAQYSIERHEWFFTRNPGRHQRLRVLLGPNFTLTSNFAEDRYSARETLEALRKLALLDPAITAATHLLPPDLQSSELIERLSAAHDPFTSDLLAFGHAADRDRSSAGNSRTIPIAALPGGTSKDNVVLVCLNQEQLGWQEDAEGHLVSTTFRDGERTTWQAHRGPIKQLRFSPKKLNRRVWLAVRFHGATVLLQPAFSCNENIVISMSSSKNAKHSTGSSRIQTNEILALSTASTGGSSHSDVAFNPFTADQLAVLDQQGCWSIWNIEERRQKKRLWGLRLLWSGQISKNQDLDSDSMSTVKDGFGRLRWVRDSDTLFAASRTTLALFGTKGSIRRLIVPSLIAVENAEYIVDAEEDSVDSSYIYVVTSTRVFCLEVYSHSSSKDIGISAGAKVLLSWRHFRSPEDLSLSISICRRSASTTLILRSRITGVSTVNTVFGLSPAPSYQLSISDSYLFDLDISKNDAPQPISLGLLHRSHSSIAALVLRDVPYEVKKPNATTSSGSTDLEKGPMLYQLIALDDNQNVHEYILSDQMEAPARTPNTRRLLAHQKSSAMIAPEHFVVPDYQGDNELDLSLPRTQLDLGRHQYYPSKVAEIPGSDHDEWTLNIEWLQHHLQRIREGDSTDIDDALKNIRSQVNKDLSDSKLFSKSLFEVLNTDIIIGDVDMASGSVKDTIQSCNQYPTTSHELGGMNGSRNTVSLVLSESLSCSLGFGNEVDLSQLYDHMVRLWVSSLPAHSPGRMRLMAEQLARKIAAHLCLAGYRLIPSTEGRSSPGEAEEAEEAEDQSRLASPVGRASSIVSVAQQDKQTVKALPGARENAADSSEPTLPTPEPTPSLRSRSSLSSAVATESLASQRLRPKVLHMLPQTFSDSSSSEIMTHWGVGLDPGLYDWEGVERSIAIEQERTEVDGPSQKRRKRRAEKQRKPLQEPAVLSSSQPVPKAARSSQPREHLATQQSTQTMGPIVMSQVEPGLHGSRKNFTKKLAPRRKAGF